MSINSLIEYILFFSILDSFIISFKNTFAFGIKNISCKYPNPKNEAQNRHARIATASTGIPVISVNNGPKLAIFLSSLKIAASFS